jgi:hypothetical protein
MDRYGRCSRGPKDGVRAGRTARAAVGADLELGLRSGRHVPCMLTWGSSFDQAALAADGHEVVEFAALLREIKRPPNARG